MSTSVASVANHFPSAENGFTTTTSGSVSSGAATVGLNSVAGYANGEVAVFVIDPSNASKQTFTGTIDTSGVQVTGVKWTAGTNTTHLAGATVVDYATATHISMITKGLLVEHNQDGTHGAMTADSLTVDGALAVTGASTLTGALTVKSWDGWIQPTDTWTYVSATSFKITGSDVSAKFPVGTKIKLTQTTAKYFYVTACSFSTDTTVTITGGSDYSLANAAITSPNLSYGDAPQGFPQVFNYTVSWTNLTVGSGTVVSTFSMVGKRVSTSVKFIYGAASAVSGSVSFSLPVTAASKYGTSTWGVGTAWIEDFGTTAYQGAIFIAASTTNATIRATGTASTYGSLALFTSTIPFTWASTDYFAGEYSYDAA